MILENYQKAVDNLFLKVRSTQAENIKKFGEMIADCVSKGGGVFLSEICHGVEGDLLTRGGGPTFYKKFEYRMSIPAEGRVRERTGEEFERQTVANAKYALRYSNIRPGDILVVSSVSGRTQGAVDLAYEAIQMGIKVVVFTSMEYARQVDPIHPSGKKLYEFATLTQDNCAPAAEAMVDVDGIDAKFAAASGIASTYIMWSATAVAIEKMLEMGLTPGLYKSANYPGGEEYNKHIIEHYEEYGW